MRLRRRRPIERQGSKKTSTELHRTYQTQSAWFAGERTRLLRKARIAEKRSILDLGTGSGVILPELRRRCRGTVVGVDHDPAILHLAKGNRIAASAEALPFSDNAFDLIFTQMFFLWVKDLAPVLQEIRRVLQADGMLIACAEPDYGGAIEWPPRPRGIHDYGKDLKAEGADTEVGRKFGSALAEAGFVVSTGTHPANPKTDPFVYVPYFWYAATCRRVP